MTGERTLAAEGGGRRRPAWREPLALALAVALGSAIGGILRAMTSWAALAIAGPGFPWGTLAVNVVGSFVIGFYSTLSAPDGRLFASARQRQFVMTGICGGFTTFSVFSLETLQLVQAGRIVAAGANLAVSIISWLAAVWLGHRLAVRLNRIGGP